MVTRDAASCRAALLAGLGRHVLPLGLFALLTGMFWIGDRALYHRLFYVAVALPAFVAVLARPTLLHEFARSPVGPPFVAFSAFTLLSILWSGTPVAASSLAKRPLYVLLLLVAAIAIRRTAPGRIRQVLVAATAASVLAGAFLLARFVELDEARLSGYGALYNPLLTSHVFGFFAALAVGAWIARPGPFPAALAAATLLLAAVIVATGSRTPLVGLTAATVWLAALSGEPRTRIAVALLAAAGALAVAVSPDLLTSRGVSFRPEIWGEALRQIVAAPLVGRGFEHPMQFPVEGIPFAFTDPHNIVLAVLYQGGAVGLALWAWLYGAAALACWRRRADPLVLASSATLIYGLAASMTEGGAFLSRPKEHWFLIWIPFALVTAATLADAARADQRRGRDDA